ncbi:MAG: cytochrome P450 [Acidobacteria bacterium]|nr:cytochrome P450 [Acidobacteriota bacterium]
MATALKPAGPRGHFLLGNFLDFSRDPLNYLTWCARQYGDVVYLRAPLTSFYLINHPDLIEDVLVTNNRNFIKDKGLRMRSSRRLFGNGLLTSDGDFWIRQRRLSAPAFHREQIAAYGEVMVAGAERMIEKWRPGQTRDVHQDMMRLTLEIVAETLFGIDATHEAHDVGVALEVVARQFASQASYIGIFDLLPTPGYRRFDRAVERLDEIIYRIIQQRRQRRQERDYFSTRRDLLSLLLEAQDDDGGRMSVQQLRDEAMTIFLAGHETTALALSWTWYLLAQHPEAENRLIAELRETLEGRAPTLADLPHLRFTEMVIKEAMRLYSPAWMIGREAIRDCQIGDYVVPRGAQVAMSQWVMHRDPRFFDQPEEFKPERWAGEQMKSLPRYAYFPFGGGPRLCVGAAFAMMEATLILATIAQRFHLALAPGQTVTPFPSITLRPGNGVRVIVTQSCPM